MTKNNVYFFHFGEGGCYYAADTFEQAKKMALNDKEFVDGIEFPEDKIKGKQEMEYIKSDHAKPLKTDYEGFLDVNKMNEIGIIWFDCCKCGDHDFEFIDHEENYRCKACGHIDSVPYVNI